MNHYYIEVVCSQRNHEGERICGDVFLSRRLPEENRVLAVLSDGMGHGVKASVLATLTASMALHLTEEHRDPSTIAEMIMRVLPVCSERQMSYSTFTIIDIVNKEDVSILEYDNPLCLVLRGKEIFEPEWNCVILSNSLDETHRERDLMVCSFTPQKEDRIIFCSDGITQSGLGSDKYLLGWGRDNYVNFVRELVQHSPYISARELSKKIVDKAHANDLFTSKDDTSCAVMYFRQPRELIICTGPPFEKSQDTDFAQKLADFNGKKIVCGATTSDIISKQWGVPVNDNFEPTDPTLPPMSKMPGVDLVTEGVLTLGKTINLLRDYKSTYRFTKGPADKICEMILDSDRIYFLVGTCINTDHYSPEMPVELEVRRSLIKRLTETLEQNFLKEVTVEYM